MKVNEDFKLYILKNIKKCQKTECWNWTKSKDPGGYGQAFNGFTVVKAHRLSFIVNVGPIPDEFCICHACDNPSCVNPSHLFIGTIRENMIDKKIKGRSRGTRGEKSHKAKLTNEKVQEIRKLFSLKKYTQKNLAKIYEISQVSISNILLNKTWRN